MESKQASTLAPFMTDFFCFIPFPPSVSFPLTLWSGGNGIFIILIRPPVLGCPFEVWFPASSGQERILSSAGFLSLFFCIYKFASLSFLFFSVSFVCASLCCPNLLLSFNQVLPHPKIIITPLFFFCSISERSSTFLCCASAFLFFLPSFFHLLQELFPPILQFWIRFSGLSKVLFRLVSHPLLNWRKAWKWTRWSFVQSILESGATLTDSKDLGQTPHFCISWTFAALSSSLMAALCNLGHVMSLKEDFHRYFLLLLRRRRLWRDI